MRFYKDYLIFWLIIAILVVLFILCIYCAAKESKEIKECYMQEIKTKECEYKLWRYEGRDKTHTIPVFIPVYHR